MNAIEFFNDDVTGYVYDFLYHMCKTAIDCIDDDVSQSLNQSTSTNAGYIQKLIQLNQERTASMAAIEEQEEEESPDKRMNSTNSNT